MISIREKNGSELNQSIDKIDNLLYLFFKFSSRLMFA